MATERKIRNTYSEQSEWSPWLQLCSFIIGCSHKISSQHTMVWSTYHIPIVTLGLMWSGMLVGAGCWNRRRFAPALFLLCYQEIGHGLVHLVIWTGTHSSFFSKQLTRGSQEDKQAMSLDFDNKQTRLWLVSGSMAATGAGQVQSICDLSSVVHQHSAHSH